MTSVNYLNASETRICAGTESPGAHLSPVYRQIHHLDFLANKSLFSKMITTRLWRSLQLPNRYSTITPMNRKIRLNKSPNVSNWGYDGISKYSKKRTTA